MADQNDTLVIISREEAKTRGLTHYFTGQPCKRGHVSPRFVSSWNCRQCITDHAKSWYWRNVEICRSRARKAYYARAAIDLFGSREKSRAASNKWRAKNPDKVTIIARNKKARRQKAAGKHTAADLAAIFKAQRGKCAICRQRLGPDRQVDHIVPLSAGGTNDRANLQWTCATCNLEKRAHDPIEFMRSIGRLL